MIPLIDFCGFSFVFLDRDVQPVLYLCLCLFYLKVFEEVGNNELFQHITPLTPFLYKYQKKLADYPTSPLSSPPLVMCVIYFTSGTVKLSDLLSPGAAVLSSADSQQKQKGPKEERGTKNKAFITG